MMGEALPLGGPIMLRTLILAGLITTAPGLRGAEATQDVAWEVEDLGSLFRAAHCMEAAATTFRSLLGEARIGHIYASDWVTHANGINGKHDAVITCGHGKGGTRATLVMHSTGSRASAHFMARRIAQIFDRRARQITQAWRDSFD